MDHFCNLTCVVAARNGFFLYARWLHPHSAHSGDRSGADPRDSGTTAGRLEDVDAVFSVARLVESFFGYGLRTGRS